MVELNYDVKSVRELQGTLAVAGIFANVIGISALFLIPTSISSQSPSGIVLRYLGGLLGVSGGAVSLGIGIKLDSLKPLEYAASKVENDLRLREFAHAQIFEQKRLEASTQEQIEGLFPQPEPVEVEPELNPEPNPNLNSPNPIPVKSSGANSTEPNPPNSNRTQTEPMSEPEPEVVDCEVEEVSEFDKNVLWDKDIFQDEVEVFTNLWEKHNITNKLELCQILWGKDIKKGSSKDYAQASKRIAIISQYAGIETGWGNAAAK